jgi:hypothetical protein
MKAISAYNLAAVLVELFSFHNFDHYLCALATFIVWWNFHTSCC